MHLRLDRGGDGDCRSEAIRTSNRVAGIGGGRRLRTLARDRAIRPRLRAAHKEAFLDDLAVLDCVKADLIEVQALAALGRNVHLEADDELIAVHIGTLDLDIVHRVVRITPFAFSFDRLAPSEHRHVAGHRLAAHDVVGPEFLAGGVELAFGTHVSESLREILRFHDFISLLNLGLLFGGPGVTPRTKWPTGAIPGKPAQTSKPIYAYTF